MGMFAGSVQKVSRLTGWNVDVEPRRCDPRRYEQPKMPLEPLTDDGAI